MPLLAPALAAMLVPVGAPTDEVASTAGVDHPAGVLTFTILDDATGASMPGRLTFIGPDGPGAALFPNTAADPDRLAVRDNVVYSLPGAGRITVPPGTYTVIASRGLEWSLASTELTIEPDVEVAWTARLVHELDTRGWVSGDFHLHTLTYSGHGDSGMKERIISIVGEGVEFAVATDHNHHTDYLPTIDEVGAGGALATVTGNEISTPIGHFNAFPLHPGARPIEHRLRDATALFTLIREHGSPFGIEPVIQVNHPRWGGIDYFTQTGLDPITGQANSPTYSDAFDSIEILNENVGWGYYDAEVEDVAVGAGRHWVLQDWYNLLNRGHRAAAVGNSDSHTVRSVLAGYPRNFVRSDTDDPSRIDPVAIAAALRRHAVFTTVGPFVEYTVNGRPEGSEILVRDGAVELDVRVQAASWIDVDRIKIVRDGEIYATLGVADSRQPLRYQASIPVPVDDDGWLTLLVEGDDSLSPIAPDKGRPIRPLAITNPVWLDADGQPGWTSPWARARAVALEASGPRLIAELERLTPARRALLVLAAAEVPATARRIVPIALVDPDRRVRLCAVRTAERIGDPALVPALERVMHDPASDPYLVASAFRAIAELQTEGRTERLLALLERFGGAPLQRYHEELAPHVPGQFARDWIVTGYFPSDDATGLDQRWGPEEDPDGTATFTARDGGSAAWRPVTARPDGYLSLLELHADEAMAANAVAYAQTWLYAPAARRVFYTLGTDDGCRLEVNDEVIHEDRERHGAAPLQQIGTTELRAGWNRVLIAVENGNGGFGLYFRVLDDEVRSAAVRD